MTHSNNALGDLNHNHTPITKIDKTTTTHKIYPRVYRHVLDLTTTL